MPQMPAVHVSLRAHVGAGGGGRVVTCIHTERRSTSRGAGGFSPLVFVEAFHCDRLCVGVRARSLFVAHFNYEQISVGERLGHRQLE